MPYRIEPVSYEHLGWLRLLYSRLVLEHPIDYPVIDEREIDRFVLSCKHQLDHNPHAMGYIAFIGHRAVGFLAGELATRVIGRPHVVARPHWLYVVPKHRGKGVARLLIATGVNWLTQVQWLDETGTQQTGVTHVELMELYGQGEWERRGFTPFLVQYYVPLDRILELGAATGNGHDATAEVH